MTTSTSAPAPAAAASPQQSQSAMLVALLAIEIAFFSVHGKNFLTIGNFFTICSEYAPLGLLALAQTPVILTGGIDLSVGSLLALCAIVFGTLWRDCHLPPEAAAAITLPFGALAGAINGMLITRLRIPALIVTLGSYSLYRGLAEGITHGAYTDFPKRFLFWGKGTFAGGIPVSLPFFLIVAVFFWLLVHRAAAGRALSAIGYSPQGARHAGIPVNARVGMVYVLSGLASAAAALIYVAWNGEARANDGAGYELQAITAVVLGGTSIFGGRASVGGTLLGLFAVAVLVKGLGLSAMPSDWAGIFTGLLLLLAIGLDLRTKRN